MMPWKIFLSVNHIIISINVSNPYMVFLQVELWFGEKKDFGMIMIGMCLNVQGFEIRHFLEIYECMCVYVLSMYEWCEQKQYEVLYWILSLKWRKTSAKFWG